MDISNTTTKKILRTMGAILLSTGLIMGALTAHLSQGHFVFGGREMAQRAMNIQIIHGLAFIMISLMKNQTRLILIGIFGLLLGCFSFCAGVYFYVFTGTHLWHAAPFGGILLIISWILLGLGWCFDE